MTILTVDIIFEGISGEDIAACYDQTDEIKKAIEKALKKLPIGKYYRELTIY